MYTGKRIAAALGGRACVKMPRRSRHRRQVRPPVVPLPRPGGVAAARPRPCLVSLDCQPSESMAADGITAKIGGVDHMIFATMCEGTCAPTGCQTGRKKRSHGVREPFRMDILAGGAVPSMARSDGAQNFVSAHRSEARKTAKERSRCTYAMSAWPAVGIRTWSATTGRSSTLCARAGGLRGWTWRTLRCTG